MSMPAQFPAGSPAPQPRRLLDQVREAAQARFGRAEPGERYAEWTRRYILFHGKRHPRDLGAGEVRRFLEHVAQSEKDPLRCLEHAHEGLTFLYKDVLGLNLGELPMPQPPKLLDRVRHAIRVRHYSPRTEDCYVEWAERFIRFHGLRHPNTMGGPEIEMFLTDLAVNGHVAASTQNQAFCACCFCIRRCLGSSCRGSTRCARAPKRLPTVLSPEEVWQLLQAVQGGDGVFRLMAGLLYGAGLRREECCRVRVHDVDLGRHQIVVRHGKGGKDRVVMLPKAARGPGAAIGVAAGFARTQRRGRAGARSAAGRAGAEVSARGPGIRLAVSFCLAAAVARSEDRRHRPASRRSGLGGAGRYGGGAAGGVNAPRRLPHVAAQLRDAPGRARR